MTNNEFPAHKMLVSNKDNPQFSTGDGMNQVLIAEFQAPLQRQQSDAELIQHLVASLTECRHDYFDYMKDDPELRITEDELRNGEDFKRWDALISKCNTRLKEGRNECRGGKECRPWRQCES